MNRLLFVGVAITCLLSAPRCVFAQYAFTNIVDSTTAGPVGTFGGFFEPSISGSTVAFRATYEDVGLAEFGEGIFAGSGGALTTIAKFGDAVADGNFDVDFGDPTISGQSVAFRAGYTTGNGVFVGSGGPLNIVAKRGDPAPSGAFQFFHDVVISGSTVAFTATYDINGTRSGLFKGSGGPVTVIIKSGDPTPVGPLGGARFPAISGENVAFVGSYGGPSNPMRGIFTTRDGALTTIAKAGDVVPVGALTDVGSPSIGGSGVAFAATYDSRLGIFFDDSTGIRTIVRSGDLAPIGTFTTIGSPSTNGSEVALYGVYQAQTGIFVGNGGPLRTLIKTGDELFGSPVTELGFSRLGFDPDGSGNIAFNYRLADGRQGVALAAVVPEPTSIGIWIVALATGVVRHRRVVSI
jgi:hypothetical protein